MSDTLWAAVIGGFLVALVPITQAFMTYLAESDKWEREQRASEVEKLDRASADLMSKLSEVHSVIARQGQYAERSEAVQGMFASYAGWEALVYSRCLQEQRDTTQQWWHKITNVGAHLNTEDARRLSREILSISHSIREQIIQHRPWWRFWDRD